ncbi:hypothetical protein J2Q11_03105 [Tenacibaculum finnmarkense genomovar finnmarkense]|uniref:hypothetical protein n=1 Tax=Tenacibaculum finnmarkense TaxID=2781243 RepID=UPI00187B3285|nr:hypothetical protein [Tenacibaculum finnmarkense]MBE7659192.1 hypothetical protein [Tenacibaculum finnmarkense genomovar finnmarkense]MCD8401910.1 hypothetical protein [Tenacibaculum finnmarkense genomovar finnmarkense]MCD8416405.1 hypothetical protein [Tenacibaculum finnmarkense genomovar finnmarkense]MCD8446023.1 hypothetical protein [Tenacibaculum finnmarkense genomovar finnmarkense]MCG8185065.1 hypothetical protein [Tenacibaculum finnmarkense genomovar finnmarkense]
MFTQKFIEENFLTKSQVLKAFLLGKEDRLFIENPDDWEEKKPRRMFYRINYFLAIFFTLFILGQIQKGELTIGIFIVYLIILLKPLVHYFALENKRIKMNIFLYKRLYGIDEEE